MSDIFVYDAFYPSEDFYKVDFKEVTNMEFPESGKIKYKTASFPDHFGDYSSSILAEFEQNDLKKLEKHLKDGRLELTENKMSSNDLNYIERKMGQKSYLIHYFQQSKSGKLFSVGFLNDNKSVIITRISW